MGYTLYPIFNRGGFYALVPPSNHIHYIWAGVLLTSPLSPPLYACTTFENPNPPEIDRAVILGVGVLLTAQKRAGVFHQDSIICAAVNGSEVACP